MPADSGYSSGSLLCHSGVAEQHTDQECRVGTDFKWRMNSVGREICVEI
jgi:hypothetical protein